MKSVLIKTSNGRLALDPELLVAIETHSVILESASTSLGVIYLQNGTQLQATQEEIGEIQPQWETYLQTDPDDGEGDEEGDDDEDEDEMTIPETIEEVSEVKKPFRRPKRL